MEKLLEIKGLSKHFPISQGFFNQQVGAVYAVNNLDFDIYKGETLSLVGESGCGKSTAGRCIIGLLEPTAGEILFKGKKINHKDKKLRRKMQIIFQNPYSSLNPRMTIGDILKEPFIVNKMLSKKELPQRVSELMEMVGLSSDMLNRYPHEFSGGQRQRIGIARALALEPDFIVADEPVSALDVSIQAQIINLLDELKEKLGLTYLFISHDLSVVKHVSNRVAVMYLGEIVEIADVEQLYKNAKHPYTQALLSSIPEPVPNKDLSSRIILKGDIPSPANPPNGCKFHTRCPYAFDLCKVKEPHRNYFADSHYATCHLYN